MKPFDFFKFGTGKGVSKGDLLISQPFMQDDNFGRTVVFICEHSEEGSFGFVINKKAELKFDEVIEVNGPFSKEVFIGGPVEQNTLHFLHKIPHDIEGVDVRGGIYWSGDYEALFSKIDAGTLNEEDVVFFLGYSGWSAGQLEKELEKGSWIVYKNTSKQEIFGADHEQLWQEVLKKMGGKYGVFANYPVDPSLN